MFTIIPLNLNILKSSMLHKNQKHRDITCNPANNRAENFVSYSRHSLVPYLSNRFNINFSGGRKTLSLKEQAQKLNLDSLPVQISCNIKDSIQSNDGKSLYDIHIEYYAPLLKCSTLDEACKLYPEFKDVINASDLDESQMSPTLLKIKNGEIEGITLEDLSLTILKTHYGKGISPNSRENFFNLSKDASYKIFEKLQIKRLDGQYLRLLGDCSPQKRKRAKERWTKEKRAALSKKANEIWTKEKRNEQSIRRKEWFDKHPDAAFEISQRMTGTTESPETRAKISKSIRQFHKDNPEYAEIVKQSWEIHSDIKKQMQDIAHKEFPYLRVIFLKQATGQPLEDYEIKYMDRYHKRCSELCPDGQKIVGKTISKMWAEHKKQKDKNK